MSIRIRRLDAPKLAFDHYQPVIGKTPTRPRTDANPLSRKEYLMSQYFK